MAIRAASRAPAGSEAGWSLARDRPKADGGTGRGRGVWTPRALTAGSLCKRPRAVGTHQSRPASSLGAKRIGNANDARHGRVAKRPRVGHWHSGGSWQNGRTVRRAVSGRQTDSDGDGTREESEEDSEDVSGRDSSSSGPHRSTASSRQSRRWTSAAAVVLRPAAATAAMADLYIADPVADNVHDAASLLSDSALLDPAVKTQAS